MCGQCVNGPLWTSPHEELQSCIATSRRRTSSMWRLCSPEPPGHSGPRILRPRSVVAASCGLESWPWSVASRKLAQRRNVLGAFYYYYYYYYAHMLMFCSTVACAASLLSSSMATGFTCSRPSAANISSPLHVVVMHNHGSRESSQKSYRQLCRDTGLSIVNVPAENALGLIGLCEYLLSAPF